MKSIVRAVRDWGIHAASEKELDDFSRMFDKHIRGWVNYYGRYYPSALRRTFDCHQQAFGPVGHEEVQAIPGPPEKGHTMAASRRTRTARVVRPLAARDRAVRRWDDGSRMSGDAHVRFWESAGVRFPRATHLPLYRLQQIFRRRGFEIDRSTMCVWAGDVADLVKPLYERMAELVRESHVIGTDDTVLPMLAPGKTKQARIWSYRGDQDHPYNVFDFTLGRGRDGPSQFLGTYNQTLLADAYGGYDGVVVGNAITRAGCWAHARRKLVDCQGLAVEVTHPALALVRTLFAIEAAIKGQTAEQRLAVRQRQSVPVLEELHAKLLGWTLQLLPKHPVTQAINYILNQWAALTVFAQDGAVDLDNNLVEQEMKRIATGRKNFLFVGNERGGRTAAILASLTSTCRRHDIDPQLYLTQLLVNLPGTPMSQLDQWLPEAWKRRQPADVPVPRPPEALVWPATPATPAAALSSVTT